MTRMSSVHPSWITQSDPAWSAHADQNLPRPELLGVPDFVSNSMAAQDCYILDSVRDYITWARKNGYAVIDVNVPKYLTANAVC